MRALMLLLLAAGAGPRFDVPGARGPAAEIPAVIDDSGHPQTAWSVQSSERPDALVRWFAREMTREGLYVAPAQQQVQFDTAAQLTGIDGPKKLAHTVLVFPTPKGALVVQAQTQLGVTVPKGPVALPEGSKQLASFGSEGFTTVLFETPASEAQVRAHFAKQPGVELTLSKGEGGTLRGAVKVPVR
jgi:hypothetical protein